MVFWIKTLGFIFARLSTSLLEQIVSLLAKLFFAFPSKRKETLINNLKYAFPEWSDNEINEVARVSAARMIEMGLFSLTYPFMSKSRWRRSVFISLKIPKKS